MEKKMNRELDARVAKIMGFEFLPLPDTNCYGLCRNCGRALHNDHKDRQEERGICYEDECFFSEDIAAAWTVLEKVTEPRADGANSRFMYWFTHSDLWAMSASEAAEAICLAALATSEGVDDES